MANGDDHAWIEKIEAEQKSQAQQISALKEGQGVNMAEVKSCLIRIESSLAGIEEKVTDLKASGEEDKMQIADVKSRLDLLDAKFESSVPENLRVKLALMDDQHKKDEKKRYFTWTIMAGIILKLLADVILSST